jgi:hypothetical protein
VTRRGPSMGAVRMAGRADFTTDEWETLRRALLSGAELVSLAGGRRDMDREMASVATMLQTAKAGHPSQLVRELASEPPRTVIGPDMSPGEAEEPVLGVLRAAAATLSSKAPGELEAYRSFVVRLGQVAAEATRSGGVFGVGGQRVSYAEASALAKVRAALGESDWPQNEQ